jgi:transposase
VKFLTLIPSTIALEKNLIAKAITEQQWQRIDDNYQYRVNEILHMDIKQRWVVIYSTAANSRATKTITRQVERAKDKAEKELFHLQAQRFACKIDAQRYINKVSKKLKYHQISTTQYIKHKVYEGKDRPKKDAEVKRIEWQVIAEIEENQTAITQAVEQKSCFILATHIDEKELSPTEILTHYKAQSAVERGFRFLKDPVFFVSSLFIKKPSRIDPLLMVITLSLLVYSIAQRRMRAKMKKIEVTIPNQINQETATPTLRWVFQCFDGINLLQQGDIYLYEKLYLDGFNELRQKIIRLIGGHAMHLYKIKKVV